MYWGVTYASFILENIFFLEKIKILISVCSQVYLYYYIQRGRSRDQHHDFVHVS